MISSWTLQAAKAFGLGVLAPGKPYDVSLVKPHLPHEKSQEMVTTPIISKVKGIIFRCLEDRTQMSARA